jgi:voltage-gated potassium channel
VDGGEGGEVMARATEAYGIAAKVVAACVFLSVAAVIVESVDWVEAAYGPLLRTIEVLVGVVFTIEYAANIYLAERRLRYVLSVWGLIDLLAILPTILSFVSLGPLGAANFSALKVIRTLRVLRVLRVLKLARTAALRARQSLDQDRGTLWLDLQIYFMALFTAMVVSASLMWYAEKDAATGFANIPEGLWFAIVTLTTTGSGAPIPVTPMGRVVAVATMLTGLALFGVLASVIGRTMLSSLFGETQPRAQA